MTREELEQMADTYVNAPAVGRADAPSLTALLVDVHNAAVEECAAMPHGELCSTNIRALKVKP